MDETKQPDDIDTGRTRVLIVTLDKVGLKMAGPAIRAWEIATFLSRNHDVRLLSQGDANLSSEHFPITPISRASMATALDWAQVVIFQGFALHLYPEIGKADKVLVCDVYDPVHLEALEMHRTDPWESRLPVAESTLNVMNTQLGMCDFFICASEKQRDFWLGQLAGVGRINPWTYDDDASLRALIDVVPFGIVSEPPEHKSNVLKGVVPGIGPDDKVALWGGGIWNWFDPLTLIRAVDVVKDSHPELKLFFMGAGHPNPEVPKMRMAADALSLSQELGLTGKHVFFNEGWIPYEERGSYLSESDIGVSCHLDHIETAFSYRTRVLDYFWAGLPVILTQGDTLSELVEKHELGLTVAPEDVEGLATALRSLLDDPALAQRCRANIESVRSAMTWEVALRPLDEFCFKARRAPDASRATQIFGRRKIESFRLIKRVAHYWRIGGYELVRVYARNYLRNRRQR